MHFMTRWISLRRTFKFFEKILKIKKVRKKISELRFFFGQKKQEYLDFWYAQLIDKIGMNSMTLETDLAGKPGDQDLPVGEHPPTLRPSGTLR